MGEGVMYVDALTPKKTEKTMTVVTEVGMNTTITMRTPRKP
jgi:hypothetical protein